MDDLLPKLGVKFKSSSQDRSQKTLRDLMEAGTKLVESGDPEQFTSRNISKISGYALGTVSNHLGTIENVFIWAIEQLKKQKLKGIIDVMENSDENLTVDELCKLIADAYFEMVGEINPKIIQFFNQLALKRAKKVSEILVYPDIFSDVIYRLSRRNKSGTIRELTPEEAKWVSRSMVLFNRRPFIEEDPVAGTEEHRRIAIDNMIRLLRR